MQVKYGHMGRNQGYANQQKTVVHIIDHLADEKVSKKNYLLINALLKEHLP